MNMEKQVKSNNNKVSRYSETKKIIGSMIAVMALFLISCTSVHAVSFSWSGNIVGDGTGFTATGTAEFTITGSTLEILLTNTSTDALEKRVQTLSALTWDITDTSVTLTKVTAFIASGSKLVGPGATTDMDLSGEWGFKENIQSGIAIPTGGTLGSFGVSAVGDIVFGADTFGINDRFDTDTLTSNLFGPGNGNLNGVSGTIVSNSVDFTTSSLSSGTPYVQNQMLFTFSIFGTLTDNEIINVNPLFGTDGVALVPEPTTIALLGIGLVGLAGAEVRRRRRKKAVDKS